jgi:hypothetical protein
MAAGKQETCKVAEEFKGGHQGGGLRETAAEEVICAIIIIIASLMGC